MKLAITEWLGRIVARHMNLKDDQIPELHDLQEVESMLEENLERWKENYKAQAMAEGMAEGEAKAARESLLKILNFRFGQLPDNLTSIISNMSDYNLLSKLQNSALTPEYYLREFMDVLPRDVANC